MFVVRCSSGDSWIKECSRLLTFVRIFFLPVFELEVAGAHLAFC